MRELYNLKVAVADENKATETEIRTNDSEDLERFLHLAGFRKSEPNVVDVENYKEIPQENPQSEEEAVLVIDEESDDRKDAQYDYGYRDYNDLSQSGRYTSDPENENTWDYEGREEDEGLPQRRVGNYGDNPVHYPDMTEEYEVCENCGCCPCECEPQEEYSMYDYNELDACEECGYNPCVCDVDDSDLKYDYYIHDDGALELINTRDDRRTFLQGNQANEIVTSLENARDDERQRQAIIKQYDYMMESKENAIYNKLVEEWKMKLRGK